MENTWATISSHPKYQVSRDGRVRSTKYRGQDEVRELSLLNGKTGYRFVILDRKTCYVHRLVAEAFLPNPDNFPQINHKDENKANNSVENLEWCSAKYNVNYGSRSRRVSQAWAKRRQRILENFNRVNEARLTHQEKYIAEREAEMKKLEADIRASLKKIRALRKRRIWDMHAVFQLDSHGNIIKEWKCPHEIHRELGLNIRACLKGKRGKVGGYYWMYKIAR